MSANANESSKCYKQLFSRLLEKCALVRSFGTLTMGRPLAFAIFIESVQKTRKLQTPHEKREKESLGSPGRCQISTFKTLQGKPNWSIVNTQDLRLRRKKLLFPIEICPSEELQYNPTKKSLLRALTLRNLL